MENKNKIFILSLPVLILLSLYIFDSVMLAEVNRTWLQILIYPVILISLNCLTACGMKLPRYILILSASFALLGVGYSYMYPLRAKRGGLVVARLDGDELQNETRIFREKINQALNNNQTIRALSINDGFKNFDEADRFIAENRKN